MTIPEKDGYYWARFHGEVTWEPVHLFTDKWYKERKIAVIGDECEYEIGHRYNPVAEFGAEIVR